MVNCSMNEWIYLERTLASKEWEVEKKIIRRFCPDYGQKKPDVEWNYVRSNAVVGLGGEK